MLLSLLAGIATRFIPGLFQWPSGDPDVRRQVARDATRLAFWLGLLTLLILIFAAFALPCEGGSDCS